MCAVVCEKQEGALGTEYSFGSVSTNDVIIRAMKKAEESIKKEIKQDKVNLLLLKKQIEANKHNINKMKKRL